MRSVSYNSSQYSTSAYGSPYSNYTNFPSSKSHRPLSVVSTTSSPVSTKTTDQTSAAKSFRKTSTYSREHSNTNASTAFSADTSSDIEQNKQAKCIETTSAVNPDRYSSSSAGRFRSAPRNSSGKSYTVQRQTSLNQDELSSRTESSSSRFTSNQKWSTNATTTKDRPLLSRSRSVEPNSRRYSETTLTSRKSSDVTSYYSDKRPADNYSSLVADNRDTTTVNATTPKPLFSSPNTLASFSSDNVPARKDYRTANEKSKADAINQQEFFQRLFRAHNIVDELLKERGIKFEEEPIHYRRWEPVEAIEEEVPHSPDRRSSSASDSGLSMDTESEGSLNTDSTGQVSASSPAGDSDVCESTFVKSSQNEYVLIVRLWTLILQATLTTTEPPMQKIQEPAIAAEDTEECYCDVTLNASDRTESDDQLSSTVAALNHQQSIRKQKLKHQCVSAEKTFQLSSKYNEKFLAHSENNISNAPNTSNTNNSLEQNSSKNNCNNMETSKSEVRIACYPVRQRSKTPKQQLLTLARNFRKKNQLCRSSAEISIQHVSFYQVSQSLVENRCPVERSVRIHLRLTERAQTCLQAFIVLYIKNLLLHVSSDTISMASVCKLKRKTSTNCGTLKASTPGKRLQSTFAKKNEQINPVRIPEHFLKNLNPTTSVFKEKSPETNNELRTIRGKLKRVPFNRTISGPSLAVYEAQDRRYSFTSPAHPINDFNINTLKINVAAKNVSKKQLPTKIAGRVNKYSTAENCDNRSSGKAISDPNCVTINSQSTNKLELMQTVNETDIENDPKNSIGSRRCVVTSTGESDAENTEVSSIATKQKLSCRNPCNKPPNICAVSTDNGKVNESANTIDRCAPYRSRERINNSNNFASTTGNTFCIYDTRKINNNHAETAAREAKQLTKRSYCYTASSTKRTAFKDLASALNRMPIVAKELTEHIAPISALKSIETNTFLSTFRSKLKHLENKNVIAVANKHRSSESIYNNKCTDEEVEVESKEVIDLDNGEASPQDEESEEEAKLHSAKSLDGNEKLTEGEKAMLAARKRQEEDQAAKLLDYEEHRRIEREKEEEELRALKEKQERRRLEREREEREFALRQEQEEKRRRQEEEERKARFEADRKKKEEEKKKRAQTTFNVVTTGQTGGRNFVIPTKTDRADKFGNIVQAKQEMGMTKEQQEEAKRNYMATFARSIDIPATDLASLKEKIRILHQKICRLEADKYDLEKRQERQEYDLRELNERQRQVARNKALKKGIDPADSLSSRYPPKVSIISKYDRQSDRRNFSERRAVFESNDEE